jgi:hypothetical protein
MAIAACRAKFTRPRAEVETAIHKFHERVVFPKKAETQTTPEVTVSSTPKRESADVREMPKTEVKHEETPQREVPRQKEEKPPEKPREAHERPKFDSQKPRREERRDRPRQDTPRSEGRREARPERGNTDELRYVLKQVVGSAPSGQEKRRENVANREELKSAITSVLREVQAGGENATTQAPPREVPEKPRGALNSPEKKPDAVTPRELERMMRVTTEDKPPL